MRSYIIRNILYLDPLLFMGIQGRFRPNVTDDITTQPYDYEKAPNPNSAAAAAAGAARAPLEAALQSMSLL